jgi:hypothetical protein
MEVMRESLHQPRQPALPEGRLDVAARPDQLADMAALPERLPWGSAALATGGLCLLLWGALIAAFAALG